MHPSRKDRESRTRRRRYEGLIQHQHSNTKDDLKITNEEIGTIKAFDNEEPDVVKSVIKWDHTDVPITTVDAELIVGLITGIRQQDNVYIVNMLITNEETETLTTKDVPLRDIF
jgi:hypothetical protein